MVNFIRCKGCSKTFNINVPDSIYWRWQETNDATELSSLTAEAKKLLLSHKCGGCD